MNEGEGFFIIVFKFILMFFVICKYIKVEKYNIVINIWSYVIFMLIKRCRLGVVFFNGKLYVVGGYDGLVFFNIVECYDFVKDCWIYIIFMRVRRSRVVLVVIYGKLYVIGGYDGLVNLNFVEMYDFEKDIWKFV